jgi:hypothetical protein
MNVLAKCGRNAFHGSAFVFHQYGGTLGGPILRDKAFFFGGYQRWTQRFTGSGFTLDGAPTDAGRAILQSAAGGLPQVQALLTHLPAADAPSGKSAPFTLGGESYTVPLGTLTGAYDEYLNNHQPTARVDVLLSPSHTLSGRYLNNTIGDMVTAPEYRHVPTGTLAILA